MPTAHLANTNPVALMQEIPLPTSPHHRRASLKVLSRNINTVVLGNLTFPTWYYSPYPDSVILGPDRQQPQSHHHAEKAFGNGSAPEQHNAHFGHLPNGVPSNQNNTVTATTTLVNGVSRAVAYNVTSNGGGSVVPESTALDTLHVCPYCFRYSPSRSDYTVHVELHVKAEQFFSDSSENVDNAAKFEVDDSKEDEHDKMKLRRQQALPVPTTATKVYSCDGYTVWDVDGEVEKLYCQNLSLFGKLFLEQKSVFFDTSGFHYFVLTYCAPRGTASLQGTAEADVDGDSPVKREHQSNSKSGQLKGRAQDERDTHDSKAAIETASSNGRKERTGRKRGSSGAAPGQSTALASDLSPDAGASSQTAEVNMTASDRFALKHQVLGFFSKENLSWDANNLACILVFPPYQHRNLGQLLMAISYKLSGWEWEGSVIGGPEKPLSAMGRKSYLRFWSERVARYVMGQATDAEGCRIFEAASDMKLGLEKKRKRGKGKGPLKEMLTVKELGDRTGMLGEDVVAALVEMGVCELMPPKRKKRDSGGDDQHPRGGTNANANAHAHATTTTATDEDDQSTTMTIHRSKVLQWAEQRKLDLINPVKEEGFLGEWALSEANDSDVLSPGDEMM